MVLSASFANRDVTVVHYYIISSSVSLSIGYVKIFSKNFGKRKIGFGKPIQVAEKALIFTIVFLMQYVKRLIMRVSSPPSAEKKRKNILCLQSESAPKSRLKR